MMGALSTTPTPSPSYVRCAFLKACGRDHDQGAFDAMCCCVFIHHALLTAGGAAFAAMKKFEDKRESEGYQDHSTVRWDSKQSEHYRLMSLPTFARAFICLDRSGRVDVLRAYQKARLHAVQLVLTFAARDRFGHCTSAYQCILHGRLLSRAFSEHCMHSVMTRRTIFQLVHSISSTVIGLLVPFSRLPFVQGAPCCLRWC